MDQNAHVHVTICVCYPRGLLYAMCITGVLSTLYCTLCIRVCHTISVQVHVVLNNACVYICISVIFHVCTNA